MAVQATTCRLQPLPPKSPAGISGPSSAAQERREVGQQTGRPKVVPDENDFSPPTAADIGINRKDIHDARIIRDAEVADPGVIERTVTVNVDSERTYTTKHATPEINDV